MSRRQGDWAFAIKGDAYLQLMKKSQIDLLHQQQAVDVNTPLLGLAPKTPQQHFLLTYLGLRLLDGHADLPLQPILLSPLTGSFSQLLLLIKYMRKCMDKGSLLDNSNFHVLSMLILWMGEQEKGVRNPKGSLLHALLLPHPAQLGLQQFEELVVYLNYIALDVIKIVKGGEVDADELLRLLEVILPRVYYNIILNMDSLGSDSGHTEDVLFFNQSLEFFTRTNTNYRALCRTVLRHLLALPLKQNQMRELLERACRFYLLFWKDHKQSTDLFLGAFEKATEAARFALTDEFVLFFKVLGKLGDSHLQRMVRGKYEWIDDLLGRFGSGAIVGHPKGEVNPFNVLGIKQNVKVEAGKTSHRIIEIYNEYSLFYFKVDIEAHDISVRLYYLGDFESKVEVKKLLLTQQKVATELRSAFVAAKKGLYMIQFDNAYSWLNNKSLKFEYILLAQYRKAFHYPVWMRRIFEIQPEEGSKQTDKKEKNNEDDMLTQKERTQNIGLGKQNQQIQSKFEEEGEGEEYQDEQQYEDEDEDEQDDQQEEDQEPSIPRPKQQIHELPQGIPTNDIALKIPQQQILSSYEAKDITKAVKAELLPKVQQSPIKVEQVKDKAQQVKDKVQQVRNKVQQSKSEVVVEIASSSSLEDSSDKFRWGQANLSLIDNIFSLLVNIQDHTYEFETNLEDRIIKRLKAYCEGEDKLHWIFNSEARDWLKRRGFGIAARNGVTLLRTAEQARLK